MEGPLVVHVPSASALQPIGKLEVPDGDTLQKQDTAFSTLDLPSLALELATQT